MFRQSERKRTPLFASGRAEEKSQFQSVIAEEETLIFHEEEWKENLLFHKANVKRKLNFHQAERKNGRENHVLSGTQMKQYFFRTAATL